MQHKPTYVIMLVTSFIPLLFLKAHKILRYGVKSQTSA